MGIPSGQELTNTLLKLDPTCRIVVTDLGPWYADGSKTCEFNILVPIRLVADSLLKPV